MSITLNSAAARWVAQDPPAPPQGPEFGGSSPIGLVVILLLAVAMVFLIRSMNKHLRKVPASFDKTDQKQTDQERSAGTTAAEDGDSGTAGAANGAGTANGDRGRSGDPN